MFHLIIDLTGHGLFFFLNVFPLVEQELLTLPEHPSSPPIFMGVRVTRSSVLCVCFVDRFYPFVLFLLAIVLYRFFFDLRVLITPILISSNFV